MCVNDGCCYANHRKLYLKTVAYYKNLIDKGEEEHLARDNTSKWAAKSNKGINGKYFCVGFHLLLSYY